MVRNQYLLLLPMTVAHLACAVSQPATKMEAANAFAQPAVATSDPRLSKVALGTPKVWARQYRRDLDCERAARDLDTYYGHDTAWTYLKACVMQGNFTQLKMLTDYWTEDLRNRPDAPPIIAQVLAARGGHVQSDIELLQRQRIPLFELGAAVKSAPAFKGRYLVFVGEIAESKTAKGKTELVVMEQRVGSEMSNVLTGNRYGSTSSSATSGSARWSSSGILGSGSAAGSTSGSSGTVSGQVETRVSDVFEDSGQEVLLKLKQDDPFLRVEKRTLFLVRFDGAKVTDAENTGEGEEPKRVAMATLVSYHDF